MNKIFKKKVFFIAEISGNHDQNFKKAKKIIKEISKTGADAIKLQTYRPDTITLNSDKDDFKIKGGLWDGRTLYELYEEAHMPWGWHKPLFDFAKKLDITIFSSPFDKTAVDMLEELNAPAYKIASFEMTDHDLVKKVSQTNNLK